MVFLLALVTIVSFGQEEIVPDSKKFEDVTTKLFMSKVVEVPNKTQKEIQIQFKNWASTAFVNLKEVLVSETDNQIVLVYITEPIFWTRSLGMKVYYDYKHYVRMVGQFKDGKCKISMIDDGNVYQVGRYSGNVKMPDTQARTIYFSNMENNLVKPEIGDYHKMKYYMYGVFCDWQQRVESTILSCEKGMKNESLVATKLKDDF